MRAVLSSEWQAGVSEQRVVQCFSAQHMMGSCQLPAAADRAVFSPLDDMSDTVRQPASCSLSLQLAEVKAGQAEAGQAMQLAHLSKQRRQARAQRVELRCDSLQHSIFCTEGHPTHVKCQQGRTDRQGHSWNILLITLQTLQLSVATTGTRSCGELATPGPGA